MDPYGHYDCFMIESRARPRYRLDEAADVLPYRLRLEHSYSNHPFYPLSTPLMKRPDDRDQGLDFFDVIALVDISPGVFGAEDIRTLRSYVESGGALLLFGGPCSLGDSVATYGDWGDFLPVVVKKEKKALKPALPRLRGAFRKFNRDLGTFGRVEHLQVVEPKPGSDVLAEVAGRPLLVAQKVGRGRVMVIPAYPGTHDGALRDGAPDTRSFFGSDGYLNLLGLCVSWLLRRDQDLRVAGFHPPATTTHVGDALRAAIRPDIRRGTFSCTVARAGHEITLDRDPDFRRPVMDKAGRLRAGVKQDLSYRTADAPTEAGIYRYRVTAEGSGEGKGRYEYINLGFYGIKTPDHGYNAKLSRVATVNVEKRRGIRARPVGFHNARAAGDTMDMAVETIGAMPAGATVSAALARPGDPATFPVARNIPAGKPFAFRVPDLQPGDYELTVALAGNGKRLDTVTLPVAVVAPLREEETRFCAVGQSTGTPMRAMRAWYDEMVQDGFNCFTMANVRRLSLDEQRKNSPEAAAESFWSELVQKDGYPLWGEYTKTVILATHGWQHEEGKQPTEPCPYTPEHRTQTRAMIRDRMAACAYFPRLLSMEIVDEPHLYSSNVDFSPAARRRFREQYGYEKPAWDTYLAARDRRRLDFFNSVIDYADTAFRAGFEEANAWLQDQGRQFPQLHHVYAQGGIHNPHKAVFDQLLWSRHCHSIEFDSYPWLYGNFRLWKEIRMGEPRYMFAYYRVLADVLDKPLGFFVETNDFYHPQECWPANTSNELLYLAAGCGTKRFHTMILGNYCILNGTYEREKSFGKALRGVMELAPLLAEAKPARTNLGVLNAWADHLYNPPSPQLPGGFDGIGFYSLRLRPYDTLYPNFVEPLNGLEVLYRAYGTLPDVVDERLLKTELPKYKAFSLIGAVKTMLPESFDLLWAYVRDGGVLIMDRIPTETTDGKPDDRFRKVVPKTWTCPAEGLRLCTARVGKGAILVIDGDLHDLMSRSYEQDMPMMREQLIAAVSGFLARHEVAADACSDNPEAIGVYEMTAGTTRVLTVISHANAAASARISLRVGRAVPRLLKDYLSGRSLPFTKTAGRITFQVTLPSREALIVGVYDAVPTRSTLTVTPTVGASGKWRWEFRLLDRQGRPARGVYAVAVKVFSPSGRRMKCFERSVPATDGRLIGEFTMPLNPEPGTWRITASEKLTFAELSATFEVSASR